MFDPLTFGKRVRRLREALALSEKELAANCGAGFTSLSIRSIESGRKDDIGVRSLVSLSLALGVTPAELLIGSQKLLDRIPLVHGVPAVTAARGHAYAWFAGLRTIRNIAVYRAGKRVTLAEQGQVPELVRLLERRDFLRAEIIRHGALTSLPGSRIHELVVKALQQEVTEIDSFLGAMGIRDSTRMKDL